MKSPAFTTITAHALLVVSALALITASGRAEFSFDSGSTGSNGPLNVTSNTILQLPPNGILNYTTINIASNAALSFVPNALNTPVYLLAQGDIIVDGTIDVSGAQGGAGGPGGFQGGREAAFGMAAGDGHGPGGGIAGISGEGSFSQGARAYGSPLLVPLVGGSGGGGSGGEPGSGGGGAILLASNTRIVVWGSIRSVGGNGTGYGQYTMGSGGAIRLVTPLIEGTGTLDVDGGRMFGYSNVASPGRIRLDCFDKSSLKIRYNPYSAINVGANMMVFSANPPRLDVTQVAGTNISSGFNTPVYISLPPGASTNQTVSIAAHNFGSVVPIRIVVTPDFGSSSSYDTNIDNTVSPGLLTVPVIVPANQKVQISAWTR